MKLPLGDIWLRTHGITRIATLAVLVGILFWQSRFTWSNHNPMYGWPVAFNNVEGKWLPTTLVADITLWLSMAGGVGYTVEQWLRKPNRCRYSLQTLLVVHIVFAVILAVGCIEGNLRSQFCDHTAVARHAHWHRNGIDVWLDVGLLTDPIHFWPVSRFAVISGIGCAAYVAASLTVRFGRYVATRTANLMNRNVLGCESESSERHVAVHEFGEDGQLRRFPPVSLAARVAIWILVTMLAFLAAGTLTPPPIH